MTKEQLGWSYNPASLILVGEITETLRAQGNVSATGTRINATADSPVKDGVYYEIPQAQVGLMQYSEFANSARKFNEIPSTETAYSGRHPWNLIGATSLDAVFYPYTTQTDEHRAGKWLPYWTEPTAAGGGDPTARELNPFNPFNTLDGISPTGGYSVSNDPWMSSGHNIAMALNYNPKDSGVDGSGGFVGDTGIYPSGSGSPIDFYFEKDHWARHTVETQGIRGVGFKAPMVLTGWGYDTAGNPVPSSGSTFHPQAMYNPHLWKSGPVDLRWDDARGVWTGGSTTKIYLVKTTNLYTPPSFSFEVDRSTSRDQFTRNAPATMQSYADYGGSADSGVLLDPEYVAFTGNNQNAVGNTYEQLDYTDLEFPFYEAFIIRETVDSVGQTFYNIWTEDCQDCGHVANPCTSGSFPMHGSSGNLIVNKKILIENPLRQALDVGDLAFTVDTGRRKRVNTGSFVGGSGENATAYVEVNSSGSGQVVIDNAGSGYIYGGFGILTSGLCASVALTFAAANSGLSSGTITPDTNLPSGTYPITVYPANATAATENLPIHWIMQAEFKSQQVVTHIECEHGMLQTCSLKIQTQGYKSCEWCGEDSALTNSF